MTPLRALCFDATGTLVETAEPVGEVYRRVALEHGVDLPAWRIEDAFRRVLRHAPPRGLTGDDAPTRRRHEVEWWQERVRQTFQATDSTVRFDDLPAFARTLFDVYRQPSAWRVRRGVPEMLATLRARRWSLAVVSGFDHRLPSILEGLDLAKYFGALILPADCGVAKPDRRIFEIAAASLEQPFGSLGYVGDDPAATLEAIRNLGLTVFDARQIPDWAEFPDLVGMPATLPPPTAV